MQVEHGFVVFSCWVMSDSATSWTIAHPASLSFAISWNSLNSCPLSWWCYLTISSSTALFSFCLQFFPALVSLPISWSSGQSIVGRIFTPLQHCPCCLPRSPHPNPWKLNILLIWQRGIKISGKIKGANQVILRWWDYLGLSRLAQYDNWQKEKEGKHLERWDYEKDSARPCWLWRWRNMAIL